MEADRTIARGPADRECDGGGEEEGCPVGIDLDDVDQPVELAGKLPAEGSPQPPGGTHHQQRQNGQEGQPGGREIEDQPARRGAARARRRRVAQAVQCAPQPVGFEGQQADPVDPDREQVAEEQADDEQARHHEPQREVALAQGDPARQRPQRQPDAEHVVHGADQEHVVVEQRKGDERQHRPAAEQRPVERHRARQDHHEAQDGVDLSRQIDVHQAHQRRHDQIHHQVGNDLPIDLIEAGEIGIGLDGRDHVHARQVIDVIRHRRPRMQHDRNRGDGEQQDEERGHLAEAEIAGSLILIRGRKLARRVAGVALAQIWRGDAGATIEGRNIGHGCSLEGE
jgi:hypothetical protein